MKFSFPAIRIFTLFAFILFTTRAYNQQLSDEVSSKLSESDQKKITKAENLAIKGDLQLSKASYPGDKQFLDMLSLGETKELKKYAGERYVASDYYKDANSLKFLIFEGNCNEFWKKYTGEKKPLEVVKQAQLKAIKLFDKAQEIRKVSVKKNKIAERFPLIFEAEAKEKESLNLLLKVLFVYLNYPVNYDQTWFAQTDTTKKTNNEPVNTNNTQTKTTVPVTTVVPIINPSLETKVKPDTSASLNKESAQQADIKPKNTEVTATTPTKPIIQDVPVIDLTKKSQLQPDTSAKLNKKPTQLKKIADKEKGANTVPGDSSLYMLANVNEDQIDQFNNFLQKKYPTNYENYIIDFQKIDYSNLQSLKDAWYRYKFGSTASDSLMLVAETTPHDSTAKDTAKQVIAQNIPKNKNQKVKNQTIAESKGKGTETVITESIATGFLFRVQIAACRVPINQNVLKGIYQGTEKIIETNEDNWYKYTIGEFNTYRQARQLREATNVPGVFVVAYLNGKRIKITPAIVSKKLTTEYPEENTEGILPDKIEFRVQLVVSKNTLDASVLKNIYNGPLAIDTIEEDGWLKYSVLAGNKLTDALELLKSINVPGAFIVSYYNHQKLNLRTAIKLTKKN
jgi:hypothetical protein